MTEYLGTLNKKSTIMMMHGDKFSVIPFTTHLNKLIYKFIKSQKIKLFLKNLFINLDNIKYGLNFKSKIFVL